MSAKGKIAKRARRKLPPKSVVARMKKSLKKNKPGKYKKNG